MATNYPGALDTTAQLKNDAVNATVSATTHRTAHNNVADAIIAVQTELGTLPKGSFADVTARLAALLYKANATAPTIQAVGDVSVLTLRAHASQSTKRLFEVQSSAGTALVHVSHTGALSAPGLEQGGVALASTHLTDTASLIREPSPTITTPTITGAASLTGNPTAPTPAVDDNTTKIATTAYVKNQGYMNPASPALTGTPTAPTPALGDDDTSIATTAFVVDEIAAHQVSSIPAGAIVPYAASTPPAGWLACDGAAVSRTTYADLFAAISTAYGVGNGSTTFNVPDLQGRSAVGKGTAADVDALGDNDGVGTVSTRRTKHAHAASLGGTSDPGAYHNHSGTLGSAGSHDHSGTGVSGTKNREAAGASTAASSGQTTGDGGSHSHSGSLGGDGGQAHTITGTIGVSGMTDQSAFLVLNHMIKT